MKVFLSCGIGDFIAIERFMTESEKDNVTEVYFCTRMEHQIRSIIDTTRCFPNVTNMYSLHNVWWQRPGDQHPFFVTDKHSVNRILNRNALPPTLIDELVDLSCKQVMKDIQNKKRTFQQSRIAKYYSSLLPQIELPFNYIAIHPYSVNNVHNERDFVSQDWNIVDSYLKKKGKIGVIVNKVDNSYVPRKRNNLIDLTNQLSLDDAFHVTCNAQEFIGCASVHSVLFSKLNRPTKIKGMWNMFSNKNNIQHKFYYGSDIPSTRIRVFAAPPFKF